MTDVNYRKIRHVKAARAEDEARRLRETYDIFLAGPFINVNEEADHADNSGQDSKRLRYWLYRQLTDLGHLVYLGEDIELRINGEKHYGPRNNAVTFERHHIANHCDVLIVIPSGPGSFCETGDWVSTKKTCEKMLLLVDANYEGVVNYINLGPVEMARMYHATVEYLDYGDFDKALDSCLTHIEDIAALNRVDILYGR